jgi:5-methylcytosine-specific restriction protein A
MLRLPSGAVLRPDDRVRRREDLHSALGGQQQGGISTPAEHPVVLAFSGSTGQLFGYTDAWEDDGLAYRFFGEGQTGPMQWERGNVAVRDHSLNGESLHLFMAEGDGWATYVDEMVCGAWDYVENVPDRQGNPRRAIVFRLIRLVAGESADTAPRHRSRHGLWTTSLEELRRRASTGPSRSGDATAASRNAYARSADVAVYVRRRADGTCEGCLSDAPFVGVDGHPYLEPHHTTRLSDGGPDHPAHVIAICPNCHRRAHYGSDADAYNAQLRSVAQGLEGDLGSN